MQCTRLDLPREICYSSYTNPCDENSAMKANFSTYMDQNGDFPYGNYTFALPLILKNSNMVKILYSNLWGLMALSTMRSNLTPTIQSIEVIFSIIMVLAGLSLYTSLIGNIQTETNASAIKRHEVVDEKETATIGAEAKSPSL